MTMKLPIQPFVKKLVLADFGQEPIRCTQANIPGRQLRSILAKKSVAKPIPNPGATLEIELSADLAVHERTIEKHAGSHPLFLDYFKIALRHHVNGCQQFLSRRQAIEYFFAIYGIEPDELNQETCERWFHVRSDGSGSFVKQRAGEHIVKMLEHIQEQQHTIERLSQAIAELSRKREKMLNDKIINGRYLTR